VSQRLENIADNTAAEHTAAILPHLSAGRNPSKNAPVYEFLHRALKSILRNLRVVLTAVLDIEDGDCETEKSSSAGASLNTDGFQALTDEQQPFWPKKLLVSSR
jgi:hypothetical protein